jgi:hypothetical protein
VGTTFLSDLEEDLLADDRHHSPKVQAGLAIKNPRSAWLQFFFKRS